MKSVWMNTLAWVGAVAAAFMLALATPHETGVMGRLPSLSVKRLDQKPLVFPEGLQAERTLALIAFRKSQRPEVESWITGLGLRGDPSISWVRISVFDETRDPAAREATERRLLSRYPSSGERANLLPVFTDRGAFIRSAGLDDTDHAYAVVLNRRGEVLARVQGEFDADKANALRETLLAHGL